jgi:pimeloyl-ACP methyl ester carboxylesterase
LGAFQVQIGSAVLAGQTQGAGPTVVLLHAGVADKRMWKSTFSALSQKYQVVSYDRRGFGETQTPDHAFRNIDDLNSVLRFLNIEAAHLIGCSQGGKVAIDFALAFPDRVRSLVLVSAAISGMANLKTHPDQIASILQQLELYEEAGNLDAMNETEAHLWLDGPMSPEKRVIGEARALFLDMNGKALRHAPLTKEMEVAPASDRLQELKMPTLVMWGDLDFPHVQSRSAFISSTLAQSRKVVMQDCAHLPNLEEPQLFNSIVSEFLHGQR